MQQSQHVAGTNTSGFGAEEDNAVVDEVDERRTDAGRPERMERCSTCRAWMPIMKANPPRGRCHRRAPLVVVQAHTTDLEELVETVWPETAPDEFCCDWLPPQERPR